MSIKEALFHFEKESDNDVGIFCASSPQRWILARRYAQPSAVHHKIFKRVYNEKPAGLCLKFIKNDYQLAVKPLLNSLKFFIL